MIASLALHYPHNRVLLVIQQTTIDNLTPQIKNVNHFQDILMMNSITQLHYNAEITWKIARYVITNIHVFNVLLEQL